MILSPRHTFVPGYIIHANFTKKSCSVKELQSGHEIVDSRPPPDFQDGRLEARKYVELQK
jgi:hypothetical protein